MGTMGNVRSMTDWRACTMLPNKMDRASRSISRQIESDRKQSVLYWHRHASVAGRLKRHCSSVTGFGAGVISVFHLSCECPVIDRSPAPNRLLYCRCLAVYNWKSKGKLLFNLSCRIPTLLIGSPSSWKYKWSNQSARHWLFCIYFSFSTRGRGSFTTTVHHVRPHTHSADTCEFRDRFADYVQDCKTWLYGKVYICW